MNISASFKYVGEVSRSPYAKSKRRPADEERRGTMGRRTSAAIPDDDAHPESNVVVAPFALPLRPEEDAEPILPATLVSSPSLMSLIDSQAAVPAAQIPASEVPPVSQAQSLFLLLAQVISED